MALSTDEKEARAAMRLERDRAFRRRYAEHLAAEQAGKTRIMAEIKPEHDEARRALDDIDAERSACRRGFQERIDALAAERDAADGVIQERWREARRAETEIWDRKMAAEADLRRRLDLEYPDLVGTRGSAAAWEAKNKGLKG